MRSVRTVLVLAVVVSSLAAEGLRTPVFANRQAAAVIEQPGSGIRPLREGCVAIQLGSVFQLLLAPSEPGLEPGHEQKRYLGEELSRSWRQRVRGS